MRGHHIPFLLILSMATPFEVSAAAPAAPSTWQTSWSEAPGVRGASSSLGSPAEGNLQRGLRLPGRGTGFTRRTRGHHYGTHETIALIQFAGARLVEAYPQTAPLLVGDISRREGGALRPHRSHQSGRDVDIALPEKANQARQTFRATLPPDQIDFEKLWFVLDALIASDRVQFVFLDRSLISHLRKEARLAGWSTDDMQVFFGHSGSRAGLIRHAPGHSCHVHIRFHCPQGDPNCVR